MEHYTLSPAAQHDLQEIYLFTADRWGTAQARTYVFDIEAACADIASGNRLTVSVDFIAKGYRKCRVGRHVIFYRAVGDTIAVIRILHEQRDLPTTLLSDRPHDQAA